MLDPQHARRRSRRCRCRRGSRAAATSFTDFAGGGYFYLDNQRPRGDPDRPTRHVYVVGETGGGPASRSSATTT